MNETDLLRRGGLGVAAIGVPLLLASGLGLPVAVAVLLVAVALAAVVVIERLRVQPALAPPAPRTSHPVVATAPVHGVLPSDTPDYPFRFSGTVAWHPLAAPHPPWHADPSAIASESVLARAAEAAASCSPMFPDRALHHIAALLGAAHDDRAGRLRAWATDVSLTIDEEDAARLEKLAGLRKDVVLWEHQRGHERNLREYLDDEVLASTGSAVVWWLARHLDDVEQAVSLIGDLHRLSRVARGDADGATPGLLTVDGGPTTAVYSPPRTAAEALVDELFDGDSGERRLFVQELGRLLDDTGRTAHEHDLRAAFDVPRADATPDGDRGDEGEAATGP